MLNNDLKFGITETRKILEKVGRHVESTTKYMPDTREGSIPEIYENKILINVIYDKKLNHIKMGKSKLLNDLERRIYFTWITAITLLFLMLPTKSLN